MCPRVADVTDKCHFLACVPSDCVLDGGKSLRCHSCNDFHHSCFIQEGDGPVLLLKFKGHAVGRAPGGRES